MMHTLFLLYLGGVIAEILEQAGHWRAFRSLPRVMSLIREDLSTLPQYALGFGIFIGVALSSVVNGLKWPYRLTRKILKSRTGHPSRADEVFELSMQMWCLQAVADYRVDARMSIHEARSQLSDAYSAVMESMEPVLTASMSEGMLRPQPSGYVSPPRSE